jgi:hypothetical protein
LSVFTIFFCGTGSNSHDSTHANYHRGELISTLARNHMGREFVDWIIVDGPGSGNLQEKEKWVPSGNHADLSGKLYGSGWEENAAHAVAMVRGVTKEGRKEHTSEELKLLRDAGVGGTQGLGPAEKPALLGRGRISPQELQMGLKALKPVGRTRDSITTVNAIGWSRGGVTCHMFANAMAAAPDLASIKINIFACDPVPGDGNNDAHRIDIRGNVKNYVAIFAADERSRGFSPILPRLPGDTERFITTMPGRHATLVGNASLNGGAGAGVDGLNGLIGPGRVTRHLAERYLSSWGTALMNTLNLSNRDILRLYDEMLGQHKKFSAMQRNSYTFLTQGSQRSVFNADVNVASKEGGTFVDFERTGVLNDNTHFVNRHHEALFKSLHHQLHRSLFLSSSNAESFDYSGRKSDLDALKASYPNLHAKWVSLGVVKA